MRNEKYVVGFLGFGNIGVPTGKLLMKKFGDKFILKKALVKDLNEVPDNLPDVPLTEDPRDILDDPEIDIVAEFMGGIAPAWEYVNAALQNGKSVVTSNKAAFAAKWDKLNESAIQNGVGIYFEATCCAGIPLLSSLKGSLQANEISRVLGIVNGTTNYILCKMENDGLSYEAALSLAQKEGLAEPDPTADVSGFDAANKLSIILSLAAHTRVSPDDVYMEGISKVTMQDIECGREMGLVLKPLAIGKHRDGNIEARVHPTFIPVDHPMASVRDEYNAVFVTGDAVGNLMFYGKGAGQYPTASALVSDIINAAATPKGMHVNYSQEVTRQDGMRINEDWQSEYFLRLKLSDRPGMMAKAASILGDCGISLAKIIQTEVGGSFASVVFLTHSASESSMQAAVKQLADALGNDCSLECMIRVERDI